MVVSWRVGQHEQAEVAEGVGVLVVVERRMEELVHILVSLKVEQAKVSAMA
jgi:hypothetical protein